MRAFWLPRSKLAIAFAGWLVVVTAGIGALMAYAAKPAPPAETVAHWPVESTLPRDPEAPTLLMFVHPGCSCSLASVGELEALLARSGDRLRAQVIFLHGEKIDAGRTGNLLRDAVERIPAVHISDDTDGREARLFGARTSGDTFVFDASGERRFHGGITRARAHAGANSGRAALEKMARDGSPDVEKTPVFGCPLFGTPARDDS